MELPPLQILIREENPHQILIQTRWQCPLNLDSHLDSWTSPQLGCPQCHCQNLSPKEKIQYGPSKEKHSKITTPINLVGLTDRNAHRCRHQFARRSPAVLRSQRSRALLSLTRQNTKCCTGFLEWAFSTTHQLSQPHMPGTQLPAQAGPVPLHLPRPAQSILGPSPETRPDPSVDESDTPDLFERDPYFLDESMHPSQQPQTHIRTQIKADI